MKQVKVSRQTSKSDFYLYSILTRISKSQNQTQIARSLRVNKQNLTWYFSKLKKKGLILKQGYGVWGLTDKGLYVINKQVKVSTLGTTTNLHALNITIPIAEGSIDFKEHGGYHQMPLNGWIPQYIKKSNIGITYKNNNNKSIAVQVWSRNIYNLAEVHGIVISAVLGACEFMKRRGALLDFSQAKVTSIHLSTRAEELDELLNKGEKIEVILNRQAEKMLPSDKDRNAKAWLDSSPWNGVETDDLEYKRNYLMMPERVAELTLQVRNIRGYAEEIANHREAIVEMKETLRAIRESLKR